MLLRHIYSCRCSKVNPYNPITQNAPDKAFSLSCLWRLFFPRRSSQLRKGKGARMCATLPKKHRDFLPLLHNSKKVESIRLFIQNETEWPSTSQLIKTPVHHRLEFQKSVVSCLISMLYPHLLIISHSVL